MLGNIIYGGFIYGNSASFFTEADPGYTFADPVARTALYSQGVISILPGAPRLVELDIEFNKIDVTEVQSHLIGVSVGIQGQFDEFGTEAVIRLSIGASGDFIANELYFDEGVRLGLGIFSDFDVEQPYKSAIQWSDIGSLDFTIDRKNTAGRHFLNLKGWIYQVKRLDDKIVAYGENGIAILTPSDRYYGSDIVYKLGIVSKQAVTGHKSAHWFIDSVSQLWQLSESLIKLDYSEYLSILTDPVMSYDVRTNLIYICDGTYGFIYSPDSKSFGAGPVNITGISYQDGSLIIAASGTISTPSFEICTDIYDFKSRKHKTIHRLEMGTDLSGTLNASIDYRSKQSDSFANTGWYLVTPDGMCFVKSYGVEFRIKVKVLVYEYFELDYLKIFGVVHRYSPFDS